MPFYEGTVVRLAQILTPGIPVVVLSQIANWLDSAGVAEIIFQQKKIKCRILSLYFSWKKMRACMHSSAQAHNIVF